MKRIDPEQIGDVLRQTLAEEGLADRLMEVRAAALWPAIVGEALASQCGKPFVNRGLMTVRIPSAALRQELTMSRSSLIANINENLKKEIIKEIRFI